MLKTKKAQKKKYTVKKDTGFKYNHEIIGILLLAFGVLTLLSFYFENSIGLFGNFIRDSFMGFLGVTAFIIPPLIIVFSFFVIFKRNDDIIKLRSIYTVVLIVLISSLVQTGSYNPEEYRNLSPLRCLVNFYEQGRNLDQGIGGGILGGLISLPFLKLFHTLGTIIIITALALVDIILLTNISIANFILNLKSVFMNSYKKRLEKKEKMNADASLETAGFEPDIVENGGNLNLEFKSKPKIIDFKIEKTSRELKAKTGSVQPPVKENEETEEIDFLQAEPVKLIVNDLKKRRSKEPAQKEKPVSDMPRSIMSQDAAAGIYDYPPLGLLGKIDDSDKNQKNYKTRAIESAKKLEETLASFGVEAKVLNITRGPAVTRFELQPSAGVKVSKIVNLADDISLNLASSGVRIEAPIPGKAAIGIEVPNKEISPVLLREVVESAEFQQHPSKLAFAIGKDISGECIIGDIARMPHLLIAGATGAGKSVCINSLVISLVYKALPNEVKLLMIDPKVVELSIYNGIPHLLIPVVTDPRKAAGALNWAVQEMINRYKLFADRAVRDLKGYNEALRKNGEEGILPQIVVIIDELADLMMAAPNEVEDAICRLAQMARAAGMHLVIATQRPSVDVITGVIKANIPSRISFAVSSQVDSRTILDSAGAEKLLGKGDMLFHPVGQPKPIRIQGAFVSEREVEEVVEFLKTQGSTQYNDSIIEEINTDSEREESNPGDNDELLPRAIEMVIETGQASVSLIQRKFKVGYARAARIIDQMEARGIVGGYEGSKPRQILMTRQQWQELQLTDEK